MRNVAVGVRASSLELMLLNNGKRLAGAIQLISIGRDHLITQKSVRGVLFSPYMNLLNVKKLCLPIYRVGERLRQLRQCAKLDVMAVARMGRLRNVSLENCSHCILDVMIYYFLTISLP